MRGPNRSGHEGLAASGRTTWAHSSVGRPGWLLPTSSFCQRSAREESPKEQRPLSGDGHGLRPAACLDSTPSWLAVASGAGSSEGTVRCHPSGVVGTAGTSGPGLCLQPGAKGGRWHLSLPCAPAAAQLVPASFPMCSPAPATDPQAPSPDPTLATKHITQTVGLGCWQHSNNNSFHFDSAHRGPCARHTGLERNQSKQSRPQGDTWPRCNMSLSFLICEKKKIVISLAGLVGRTTGDTGREYGV